MLSHKLILFLAVNMGVAFADDLPKHNLPASKDGNLVVGNCDGEGSVEIKGKKPGEKMTSAEAQSAADQMMKAWSAKHPDAKWQVADNSASGGESEKPAPKSKRKANSNEDAREAAKDKVTKQSGAYSTFTEQDIQTWDLEQKKLIARGNELFHDGTKLGGTTGMACAMCHPNASNTHPETYPKFQVQLQRVAMLRDMINWCLENPIKAPLLKDDDPKMHALEAYIISQRKGTPLYPGRH